MQIVTSATPDTVAICLIVNERLTRKPALREIGLKQKRGLTLTRPSNRADYTRSSAVLSGYAAGKTKKIAGFSLS